MEIVVKEALSMIIKDWLQDVNGKTFCLLTEDVITTKNMFCMCLEKYAVDYQVIDDKLIIGNKKIYIYDKYYYL